MNETMAATRAKREAGRLTWVAGDRPQDQLDEVSRKNLAAQPASGTSIFDPVLCEVVYRWFSPPGGTILDPFAGGSVRGIVAGITGLHYTGIDLSERQLAANRDQWAIISARHAETPRPQALPADSGRVPVKVSAAMARLRFNGCEPSYIRNICHAACCESTTEPSGILVTIHPSEIDRIESRGGVVNGGFLQPRPGENLCSFKTASHLCGLHETADKPFGCIASPFTLNANDTLIVRNRYKLLKCYDDGNRRPAYRAFRSSLDLLFGITEAERICGHLERGGGDLMADMPAHSYRILKENDAAKQDRAVALPEPSGWIDPSWRVGDAEDLSALCPGLQADLVFTCPPYADLEVYSDDPRDLSTMDYPAFLAAYRTIIGHCVQALKPDRFACFVVGDMRGPDGCYRGLPWHTVQAFQDAGARLYNEAVLVTMVGSLPKRVGKQFGAYRKLGKTHQNVLVFVKGDPRRAAKACGPVDVADMASDFIEEA